MRESGIWRLIARRYSRQDWRIRFSDVPISCLNLGDAVVELYDDRTISLDDVNRAVDRIRSHDATCLVRSAVGARIMAATWLSFEADEEGR